MHGHRQPTAENRDGRSETDRVSLQVRFLALAERTGLPPGDFDRLDDCYCATGRHYHGWRHIAECLQELDRVRDRLADPDCVETALWYHDAVYVAGRTDNEVRSAEMAYKALSPTNAGLAQKVRDYIEATDYGRPRGSADQDLDYLTDIDLAAFGKPFREFWEDVVLLRLEQQGISGSGSSDHLIEFYLSILQGQVTLFRTGEFIDRYWDSAQANLRRAIDRLRESDCEFAGQR